MVQAVAIPRQGEGGGGGRPSIDSGTTRAQRQRKRWLKQQKREAAVLALGSLDDDVSSRGTIDGRKPGRAQPPGRRNTGRQLLTVIAAGVRICRFRFRWKGASGLPVISAYMHAGS
jgi:hypothetical protein